MARVNYSSVYDKVGTIIGRRLLDKHFCTLQHADRGIHTYMKVPIFAKWIDVDGELSPVVILFNKEQPLKVECVLCGVIQICGIYGKSLIAVNHYYPHDKLRWNYLLKYSDLCKTLKNLKHSYINEPSLHEHIDKWEEYPVKRFMLRSKDNNNQ